MKHRLLAPILLAILGVALILWGVGRIALDIIGEPATAVITQIRREGGERTDSKPGRYNYNINYTFTLPDGKEINGFTKQIGSGIYQKADATSTVRIRYFPGFPYFSALERDVGMGAGPIALIVAGCVLVFWMVRPKKTRYMVK